MEGMILRQLQLLANVHNGIFRESNLHMMPSRLLPMMLLIFH
jgi:hypothetical protein